ncbi:MAG: T9SS type A sorting domain-containing protein [Bacteroidota bacterium]
MKQLTLSFLTLLCTLSTFAQGNWTQLADFPDIGRERAFDFKIGDKFYVGTGRDINWLIDLENKTDVWEYDFAEDKWTQLGDFPGGGIRNAASFVLNDTAYIAAAFNNDNREDSLFWKYDARSDTWTQLPDLPFIARTFSTAFAIDGKGYVGLGGNFTFSREDGMDEPLFLDDFYQYDPATGEWTEVASFPGGDRWRAFSFVIDGQAYVGGGDLSNPEIEDFRDTYRYDPATDTWTAVADFPSLWGIGGFHFSLDGKGYVNEGMRAVDFFYEHKNDLLEYDPATDTWSYASTIIGPQWGRLYSFMTTYEGKAYVGGGGNYSGYINFNYDDCYVWDKNAESKAPESEVFATLGSRAWNEAQNTIYSIAAVSEDTIWTVAAGMDYDQLAPLEVNYSFDGGASWTNFTVDEATDYNDTYIYAVDGKTAYLLSSLGVFNQAVVHRTTDGGTNWEEVLSPDDNDIMLAKGLHFFDSNVGLCWGITVTDFSTFSTDRVMYRTTDGGDNWTLVSDISGPAAFIGIDNLSGNNGYDVIGNTIWMGESGNIIRSTDQGLTWETLSSFPEFIYSIAFENELEGMTVTDNFNSGNYSSAAFRTFDGGRTWEEVEIPNQPVSTMIEHIPNTSGGYLVSGGFWQYSNKLLYTPNAGDDWYELEAPNTVQTMQFLSKSLGFIGASTHPNLNIDLYKWASDFQDVSQSADLELNISTDNTDIGIYEPVRFKVELTNNSSYTASNVEVVLDIDKIQLVAVGESVPIASKGTYKKVPSIWAIDEILANETLTLEIDIFTLSASFNLFGEVISMAEDDIDSRPNNGECCTDLEDDEAVFSSSGTNLEARTTHITNIDLFPNPVKDYATITFYSQEDIIDYQLFTSEGQQIKQGQWTNTFGENRQLLTMENLPAGEYVLRFSEQSKTLRITKI